MGIERFFASINKEFVSVTNLDEDKSLIYCTQLYFDFNSIVHNVSVKNISDINKYLNKEIDDPPFTKVSNPDLSYYNEKINEIIITNVKEYIKTLLQTYFKVDKLKNVLICIDGVPTKAKMIEQKKRRYMGLFLQKIIGQKDGNLYWDKGNISPGTIFMNNLTKELNSEEFVKRIKDICVDLDTLSISDSTYIGEAEKKIIDCINSFPHDKDDKIVVYSPDADMILLLMMVETNNELSIFRTDQISNNLINVNKFKQEMFDYVDIKGADFNNTILDIVIIFTVLGDDFVPKLEPINTHHDINLILDCYIVVKKELDRYLVDNQKINNFFMLTFFKLIGTFENILLERNHNERKYKNYNYVIQNNFMEDCKKITISEDKYHEFNDPKNKHTFKNFRFNILTKLNKDMFYETIEKHKHTLFGKEDNKLLSTYGKHYIYKIDESTLILHIFRYLSYVENRKIPLNIPHKKSDGYKTFFQFYDRESKSKYHNKKMENLKNDHQIKEYKITNRLDKYYDQFNSYETSELNGSKDSRQKYYDTYFNGDRKKACESYFHGVMWTFQYYHNNVIDYEWKYRFTRTPLIKDIILYLESNDINKFSKDINETDDEHKFTQIEQLSYISPKSVLFNYFKDKDIVNKLKKFTKEYKNGKFYVDVDEKLEIDCSHAIFVNKCNIKIIDSFAIQDQDFLIEFRKYISYEEQIKKTPINYKQKCLQVEY
jgi:5'-3' exonuclease